MQHDTYQNCRLDLHTCDVHVCDRWHKTETEGDFEDRT